MSQGMVSNVLMISLPTLELEIRNNKVNKTSTGYDYNKLHSVMTLNSISSNELTHKSEKSFEKPNKKTTIKSIDCTFPLREFDLVSVIYLL